AQLEAAHAFQRVERPAGRFAEFAVVDDVNAGLLLSPHNFGDGVRKTFVVGAGIVDPALVPRSNEFQKLRRTDEASDVSRQNAITAALHEGRPYGLNSIRR